MTSSETTTSTTTTTIYALDFDGVLVDSASETGQSGWKAAKILFPNASWIQEIEEHDDNNNDANKLKTIIERFCQARPCLETGWEAALIIKLLADPAEGNPTNDEILDHFQSTYRPRMMTSLKLDQETCKNALAQARNGWIAQNDAQDWLDAHDFYHGACTAVRTFLKQHGNENLYIITTKAKEYAQRLLEKEDLYKDDGGESSSDTSKIETDHIFGLGSGPKHKVLASLLEERNADRAMMIEDNLKTLDKIMAYDPIKQKTTPFLASWGYNTKAQQERAKESQYRVLSETDPSTLCEMFQQQ
ncbi:unnamed protein product [Cylindrotheca closterium]|uniref:Uncharacterized protein n=1 Tax=Cylindrotheca closterium TaxID=2856 RepID=A0AAD2FQ22_9STRA|nr:unnamed protein product [Cylindrotheca closterium]